MNRPKASAEPREEKRDYSFHSVGVRDLPITLDKLIV